MMIGKINIFNYNILIIIISFITLLNSIFVKNNFIFILYIISIIVSSISTEYGIKLIKKYNISQIIRTDGPSSHLSKSNTPTMGGLFIIPIFFLLICSVNIISFEFKILLLITIFGFFLIGFIDDYLSIKNKRSLGLKSKQKLILQIIFSSFFVIFLFNNNLINNNLNFINDLTSDLKVFIIPISIITIISLSNSVNLTDGLDGLAAGCSSIVFCGLGTEILLNTDKNYLIFSILSFCMSGLCLGFLKHNKYPAKIFMGDTGSLTIGAIIGIICVVTNTYFTTFIISGLFVIEALSVILQVSYFKITKKLFKQGKRIFLMTPIHHHFELQGIKEEKIVEIFWFINIFLIIFSIVV
tara:strand:- start:88 stop:1152 length:1065 start_codon:yes stop_codon:yes gene_type:complete